MVELVQENWILFVIALVVGLLVAWWIFAATRRTSVEIEQTDEAEAAPARRNQALIDAPPAAATPASEIPLATPVGMAGVGEALAAASTSTPPPAQEDEQTATPVTETAPEPQAAPPAGEVEELTRIKGLGPKLAEQLSTLGITSLAQIAAWDDADIDRIDAQLGRFQGRIRRDNWPEQARLLMSGDLSAYEARFGRL